MSTTRDFGQTEREGAARLLTLGAADRGLVARVTDFGATLVGLDVPDRDGAVADVVLGFDAASDYASRPMLFFGGTIGRVANRIAGASLPVGDQRYRLAANEGPHHLHGGRERPFHLVRWEIAEQSPAAVTFAYVSPDGEEGYPGRIEVRTTFRVTDDALVMEYEATTDAPTPVNLTNHSYWNLRGAGTGSVLDHEVQVHADVYTPTDDGLIPTGALAEVAGTPLDFRKPTRLGAHIDALVDTPALGYDHNYAVRDADGRQRPVVQVRDPRSGRVLELRSDQPALQLYSGNRLETLTGKGGATYDQYGGMCLEPQAFPDAVHHPQFPSTLLAPGETYHRRSVYRFSTD